MHVVRGGEKVGFFRCGAGRAATRRMEGDAAEEDRPTPRDGDHPYRPHLPIPSPRNLASSTSTGHDRLDLFGALLRFAA